MSKHSRKARKQARAQTTRAVEEGDIAALAALARTSPDRAATAMAALLEKGDVARDALACAARTAAELRRAGKLSAAGTIARAGAHSSRALALELAVVAFATGNDEEAERLARSDGSIDAVMRPLLDAAAKDPAATVHRRRSKAALDALHAAAAQVAAARLGKPKSLQAKAKASSGLLAETIALSVRPEASSGAEPEKTPKAKRPAVRVLSAYRRINSDPRMGAGPVGEAALAELAEAAPAEAKRIAESLPVVDPRRTRILGRLESASPQAPGRTMALAVSLGADAFRTDSRGLAFLYRGFGLLATRPKEAEKDFDRAVELGADLTEVYRGKLLIAMKSGERCASCDALHGDPIAIAQAAERLAKTLRRIPSGSVFAAEADLLAAEMWSEEFRERPALLAVERARSNATAGQAAQLDRTEATIRVQTGELALALDRIDRALAHAPSDGIAWLLKIKILKELGRSAEVDECAIEAAKQTDDRDLAELARSAHARSRKGPPFDGLSPGRTTPGALAAELERATEALPAGDTSDPMTPLAWECRRLLPDLARLAFDAATLVIGERTARGPAPAERLARLLGLWVSAGPDGIMRLVMLAGELLKKPPNLAPSLDELLRAAKPGRLVVALARGALAYDRGARNKILARSSASLSRTEIDAVRGARAPSQKEIDDLLRDAARELEPEFAVEADPPEAGDGAEGIFPPELRARLPEALRARVDALDTGTASMTETMRTMGDLAAFMREQLGVNLPLPRRNAPWR